MAEKIRAWEDLTEEERKRFLELVDEQDDIRHKRNELMQEYDKLTLKSRELDKERELLHNGKWLEAKEKK